MIRVRFDDEGLAFSASRAAEEFCRDAGISVGPPQGKDPRVLQWGEAALPKWRNLAPGALLDGKLTGDPRNGPVHLEIADPRDPAEMPPAAPINLARTEALAKGREFLSKVFAEVAT